MLVLPGSHWRIMVYKTKAQVCYWEWMQKGNPSRLTFNVTLVNSCLGWWHYCHITLRLVTSEGVLGESLCTSFLSFLAKRVLFICRDVTKLLGACAWRQGCSLQVICCSRTGLCLLQWIRWGWWKSVQSCDSQLEGQKTSRQEESLQVGGAGWLAALWRRVSGLAADAGGHQSCFYFITLVEVMPYSSACGESQETSGVVECSGEVAGGDSCPQSSVCQKLPCPVQTPPSNHWGR